jgi:DMSO/TMAO reductase YedYZ heme-binding membrane subunit
LLLGGLGYVVLLALVLTSNDAAVKRLGARWKTLHRFGVHYLWLIFTLTYLGRIAEPNPSSQSYVLFALALGAAALRLAGFVKGRGQPKAV